MPIRITTNKEIKMSDQLLEVAKIQVGIARKIKSHNEAIERLTNIVETQQKTIMQLGNDIQYLNGKINSL